MCVSVLRSATRQCGTFDSDRPRQQKFHVSSRRRPFFSYINGRATATRPQRKQKRKLISGHFCVSFGEGYLTFLPFAFLALLFLNFVLKPTHLSRLLNGSNHLNLPRMIGCFYVFASRPANQPASQPTGFPLLRYKLID